MVKVHDKTPTVTQFGSQSLATQTALNEAANKQQRLNMEKGAELDRINAEFFAGQDIRRTQATGAENRLATRVAGEETRATHKNSRSRRSCNNCNNRS